MSTELGEVHRCALPAGRERERAARSLEQEGLEHIQQVARKHLSLGQNLSHRLALLVQRQTGRECAAHRPQFARQ